MMSRYYEDGRVERWDSERFSFERDRNRRGSEVRESFEDTRSVRSPTLGRFRERSVDRLYERRSPRGFEEDEYESRDYYYEPRCERERPLEHERGKSITIEKEREYHDSPSPPRRSAGARPAFLRRQSSLDTFDRRPLTKYVTREEYGPPARYRERAEDDFREEIYRDDVRLPPMVPIPLPRTREVPRRRYVEKDFREYEDIKVAEPEFYGDEEYRGFPERIREREIFRRRRRSRSRESKGGRSVHESVRAGSIRSESVDSSSTEEVESVSVRSEFPKKGKTRMPLRLINKRAIIDLGYAFEEEGDVIIIQKALGRENIDEVIKLSENYKASEKVEIEKGQAESETVVKETRTEIVETAARAPSPAGPPAEIIEETKTKIYETRSASPPRHHHHHGSPIIIDAGPRGEFVERSDFVPVGPLALAAPERHRSRDERAIRAELRALESQRRAERDFRRAEQYRRGARSSEGELVLYEKETFDRPGEEITLVKRERISEPDGGVRIEKNRKAPPPALVRAMLKTLT